MRLLSWLDIPLWAKKSAVNTQLFCLNPCRFAKVWVLLSHRLYHQEAYKIYTGMLKVLNLEVKEVPRAWLKQPLRQELLLESRVKNINFQEIDGFLNHWQPESVLLLGRSLWELVPQQELHQELHKEIEGMSVKKPCYFASVHPQELVETPSLKREAYTVLLSLKTRLESKMER